MYILAWDVLHNSSIWIKSIKCGDWGESTIDNGLWEKKKEEWTPKSNSFSDFIRNCIFVGKYTMKEDCEKLSNSQTAVPHANPIISDDPNYQDRKRWSAIKPAWPTQTISRWKKNIYIYMYVLKLETSSETNFGT